MNEQEFDILQSSKDLKKMPFTVPKDYFETLKAEARKCTEPQYVCVNLWTRIAPYASIAAMFLFIMVLGKVFVRNGQTVADAPETTIGLSDYEDYLVYNGLDTDVSMYYLNEEVTESSTDDYDDIIEYLIYIGASEEYIEYYKEW